MHLKSYCNFVHDTQNCGAQFVDILDSVNHGKLNVCSLHQLN